MAADEAAGGMTLDAELTPEEQPWSLFATWLKQAQASEVEDPNAMALATVSAEGRPSVRMVLLKDFDEHGFVFYTNLESRKGEHLLATGQAALCFHWKSLRRQVRVEGPVAAVGDAEADSYFATRPRGSQIGAWASRQSRTLTGRIDLEKRVAEYTLKFGFGAVPRPPHWSGFRLAPDLIEFWRDRPFRLHERIEYRRDLTQGGDIGPWRIRRLFP